LSLSGTWRAPKNVQGKVAFRVKWDLSPFEFEPPEPVTLELE
jgi:hypothetical protein